MEKEELEHFRGILEGRLNALLKEAKKTVTGMTAGRGNCPDLSDQASLESDQSFLLRIRDRERKLILKIKTALKKIEDGTFGICERCGDEISEKRLLARPVTEYCIDCKEEMEAEEKLKGS
jgi:DnaK suppressor protein